MRSTLIHVFACVSLVTAGVQATASAQTPPELPQPSPKARVEQRIGLTDFAVDYSSPTVKGRKIWGELVPFDRPWRTGANAATKLTASRDFVFAGKAVPAGSYALYTIPSKASWTVVLNSSTDAWGNDGFDAKKDIVRVTVKPEAIRGRDRLTFLFSATTDSGARLELEWEKLRISMPIQVDTKTQAMANLEKAVEDAWRPHFAAARYLLDNGGDLDKALGYIDQSIAIKPTWWNNWIHAQLLAKKGRTADAIAAADKTLQLGAADKTFESFFKPEVDKALAGWKQKH